MSIHEGIITLYDIPTGPAGDGCGKPWSPNTWKARFALNFKGLPYKTVYLTYPEIESTLKAIGARPTSTKPDTGADHYTLPVIADASRSPPVIVEDSLAIAQYLDATYPAAPRLFPPSTRALQSAFLEYFTATVGQPSRTVLLGGVPALLDPAGAAYFHASRKAWYGKSLDELAPPGPVRETAWKAMQDGWGKLAAILDKNGDDGPWITGGTPVYADFVVLSLVVWIKHCATPAEWEEFQTWHGGRWGKLYELGGKWMQEH